jgi:hypothetical protein
MRAPRGGFTTKQYAYALKIFGGNDPDKKTAALNSGYSVNLSNSTSSHIENSEGFHNAMAKLAHESNNLAMAAMHELQSRGFDTYSNKEMIQALTAISNAWAKFVEPVKKATRPAKENALRTIIIQQAENKKEEPEKPNLDF